MAPFGVFLYSAQCRRGSVKSSRAKTRPESNHGHSPRAEMTSCLVSLDRDWWPECGNVTESLEQGSEEVGQFAAFDHLEASNTGGLGIEKRHECVLGQVDADRCEADDDAPAVARVGGTADQPGVL